MDVEQGQSLKEVANEALVGLINGVTEAAQVPEGRNPAGSAGVADVLHGILRTDLEDWDEAHDCCRWCAEAEEELNRQAAMAAEDER